MNYSDVLGNIRVDVEKTAAYNKSIELCACETCKVFYDKTKREKVRRLFKKLK